MSLKFQVIMLKQVEPASWSFKMTGFNKFLQVGSGEVFPIDEVQEDDETVVFGGFAKGGGHPPATHLPPLNSSSVMSRDENGGVVEPIDEDDEWQDVDIR